MERLINMWFVRSGARVTGPFSEDDLRAKRRLGEFSPTHQISTDRVRWESAAPLIQMFDGSQPSLRLNLGPAPAPSSNSQEFTLPTPPGSSSSTSPKAVWYYLDANRQQVGPVPEQVLRDLLNEGRLAGNALACKVGENRWDRVKNHADLAPFVAPGSPRVLIAWVGGAVAVVAAGLAVAFAVARLPRSPIVDGEVSRPPSTTRGEVVSIGDQETLKKAVGLVVCGWTIAWKDGDVTDMTGPSGTCFTVDPAGHLVTNKHVVEEAEKRQRMTREYVLADLSVILARGNVARAIGATVEKGDKAPTKAQADELLKAEVISIVTKLSERVKEVTPKVWVFLGSREEMYPAKVVYVSERHDMAVLKIEAAGMPHFRLATKAEMPTPPNNVYAIGYPGTSRKAASEEEQTLDRARSGARIQSQFRDRDFIPDLTTGTVVKIFSEDAGGRQWVQHNATINPGNSGGPLVTSDCKAVAINTQFQKGERDASATLQSLAVPQLQKELAPFLELTTK